MDGVGDACNLVTVTVTTDGNGVGTVVSNPPGIRCGQDGTECQHDFEEVEVVFTVETDVFSEREAWGGACAEFSSDNCILDLQGSGDLELSATITQPQRPHPTIIALTHIPTLHMMDRDGTVIGTFRVNGLSYWQGVAIDTENNAILLEAATATTGFKRSSCRPITTTTASKQYRGPSDRSSGTTGVASDSNATSNSVAVDGDSGFVYWFINYHNDYRGLIQRCPIADCSHGNVEEVFDLNLSGGFGSYGMAWADNALFFSTYNNSPSTYSLGVNSIVLDDDTMLPAEPSQLYHFANTNEPEGVAVGGKSLCGRQWLQPASRNVRFNTDGTSPLTLYSQTSDDVGVDGEEGDLLGMKHIAVDADNGHLYVNAENSSWPAGDQRRLYRMNTTGSGITHIWSTMWTFSGVVIMP